MTRLTDAEVEAVKQRALSYAERRLAADLQDARSALRVFLNDHYDIAEYHRENTPCDCEACHQARKALS